jgi:hypothetical protein
MMGTYAGQPKSRWLEKSGFQLTCWTLPKRGSVQAHFLTHFGFAVALTCGMQCTVSNLLGL